MMVTIDKAGRIVIPKEIRDELDLTPDSELTIAVEGSAIRIERSPQPRRRLAWTDDGRPYFSASESHVISDLDVQRLRDAHQR